jgi:general secretion pathway protein F
MAKFSYRALGPDGQPREGTIDASAKALAVQQLQKSGLTVLRMEEGAGSLASTDAKALFAARIGGQQLVEFSTESSALLDAKIPLESVLKTQADLCTHARFKEVLSDVWKRVNSGSSFADALAQHPKVFERFFVNMVRGGEASGSLELIMQRIAGLLEHRAQMRSKILSALIYPSLLIVMGIVVVFVMMLYVVPKMTELFDGTGQVMPAATRLIIDMSNFTRDFWWIYPAIVAVLVVVFKVATRSEEGKAAFGRRLLKVPVLGMLIGQAETSRFCRMLGALLDGQVPILQSISISGSTLGNAALRAVMREVADAVQAGRPMGPLLTKSEEFPALASRMITMGEESGELHTMLSKVADRYEAKVSASTERLVSVIEPVFIILMGVIVGFIVVGMMQGIMAMSTAAG